MKIRKGFVSNSSSASFIVTWGFAVDFLEAAKKYCEVEWLESNQRALEYALFLVFDLEHEYYTPIEGRFGIATKETIPLYDQDKKEIVFKYGQYHLGFGFEEHYTLDLLKFLLENTKVKDNKFVTTFHTSMYNTPASFGEGFQQFITALNIYCGMHKDIQIYDLKMDQDYMKDHDGPSHLEIEKEANHVVQTDLFQEDGTGGQKGTAWDAPGIPHQGEE